ncbi:MAG: amino acid adenylation domain-containing protein [Cyanobacteria bacterium J06623_7]
MLSFDTNIVNILQQRAKQSPDKIAYVFLKDGRDKGDSLTYAELDFKAKAIARELLQQARAGDRALLLYSSSEEFLPALFGCLYAGIIAVPTLAIDAVRMKRALPRLKAITLDCEANLLLTTAALVEQLQLAYSQDIQLQSASIVVTDTVKVDDKLDNQPIINWQDIAYLQYTSGSTSTPKGVIIDYANLNDNLAFISQAHGYSEASICANWMPFFHDYALVMKLIHPIYAGIPCYEMSPISFIKRPIRWLEAISRYRVTHSGAPNFGYDYCVSQIKPEQLTEIDLSSWIVAHSGAEPIRPRTLEQFAQTFAPYGFQHSVFHPLYGLAEATLIVTTTDLSQSDKPCFLTVAAKHLAQNRVVTEGLGELKTQTLTSCGSISDRSQVVIVNPETQTRCRADEVGEIWVSSPSVARGYWNRPQESQQTFAASLADLPQQSFLRTGDLGFIDRGQLFVTGRCKDLIIINGQNYYPQDIELTVEQSHRQVRDNASAVFTLVSSESEELVCVVELDSRGSKQIDTQAVFKAISQAVAQEHELAFQTIVLLKRGSIAKTSSGKIKRHACRQQFSDRSLDYVAIYHAHELGAASLTEQISLAKLSPIVSELAVWLAEIWQQVLGISEFSLERSFFELGGDSIKAAIAVNQIQEQLAEVLPLTILFSSPTVIELARSLHQNYPKAIARCSLFTASLTDVAAQTDSGNTSITQVSRQAQQYIPLSSAQQRLWFLDRLEDNQTSYNMFVAWRLQGHLNVSALEKALAQIIERHEVLRTNFTLVDGTPKQIIQPASKTTITLPIVETANESAIAQILEQERSQPFDLERDALIRFKMIQLNSTEQILAIAMHHIVTDGWSLELLARELTLLYEAFDRGEASPLAKLPVQYADFAAWQQQQLTKEFLAAQLAYWQPQLQNAPPLLELPTDKLRPKIQTFTGKQESLTLSPSLSQALVTLSRSAGVTIFVTLLTSFKILLSRWSGSEDIILGSPMAGRNRPEIADVMGFFINTVVLRTDLVGNPSFHELLNRVKEVTLRAIEHQDMPFDKLVDSLQIARSLSHTPLFQVWFNMINLTHHPLELPGLEVEPISLEDAPAKFDLTLYVKETSSGIKLDLVYNADLFTPAKMQELLRQLEYLLQQVVVAPNQAISQFSLVTPQAKSILPNPKEVLEQIKYEPVTTLFDVWVRQTPQQPVIYQGDLHWTYSQLSASARSLARVLLSEGLKPGEVVAVYGERSYGLIASMMAVFLSGGVLLTLDRTWPLQRQQYVLEAAQASKLLYVEHENNLRDKIDELVEIIAVDPDTGFATSVPAIANLNEVDLPEPLPLDDAYIFFTSGTTGVPKGILGSHQGLAHFLAWQRDTFAIAPQDRCAQLTGIAFDVVLRDIFLPLTSGAALILPEDNDLRGDRIFTWLEQHKISILHTVPTLAQSWLSNVSSETTLAALRWVFFAGEPLTDTLVKRWRETFSAGGTIVNLYGPTETTLAKCFYIVPQDLQVRVQPIGLPIPATQALVMAKDHRLCGIGETGEIVLRTPFSSLGYINFPEENEKRFIPNFHSGDQDDLLYYTGDLGRYQIDGSLEILGRDDDRVKIAGIAIEPQEIESVLTQHPHIEVAVVLVKADPSNQKYLIAYVVPTQEIVPPLEELRTFLKQTLPKYMLPGALVPIEAIPLTANGKVDRRALLAMDIVRQTAAKDYVPPRNAIEQKLAKIWSDVLWLEQLVGIHDDFFDLGGHSLLSVRLIEEIERQFQRQLPVSVVFNLSTIAELATALDAANLPSSESKTLSTTSLKSSIYHQITAYTAAWQGKRATATSLMVGLNTEGNKQPIFWCVQGFRELTQLANHLGTDQPLYGMRSGHLVMEYTPANVRSLAAHYVAEILGICPQGDYILGGNCQSALIIWEVAQQLISQGKTITLLCLMEKFIPQAYSGRVALFFGRGSKFNPYKRFRAPELGIAKFYSDFTVNIFPGEHGQFFNEPNIQILTQKLVSAIARAQSEVLPCNDSQGGQLLPRSAYSSELSTFSPLRIAAGEALTILVKVKNTSSVTWQETDLSGIRLGNHWLDESGEVVAWSDAMTNLDRPLLAQNAVDLYLRITAPEQPGVYKLELDLVEEGITWFKDYGSTTTLVEVEVVSLDDHTWMEISDYGFPTPGDRQTATMLSEALQKLTPQFIGATGGSGTRVVAQIVQQGGMFIGNQHNRASDSLEAIEYLSLRQLITHWQTHLPQSAYAQIIQRLEHGLPDYLAGAGGLGTAQPWGWKIPPSIFLLPFLQAQFPQIKCLHLVRDGRDMAFSRNQNQLKYLAPLLLSQSELSWKQPLRSIALWQKLNLKTAAYAEKHLPDRYLRIRFEDLCTRPVKTITEIFTFFGLTGDIEQIARTEVSAPASLGRWRNQDRTLVKQIEQIAGSSLEKFGYLETNNSSGYWGNGPLNRQNSVDFAHKGDLYFELGDFESAIASYQNAIKLAPQPSRVHQNLGTALKMQGDFAAAITAYDRALALDNQNAQLYYLRGKVRAKQAELATAANDYRQAIAFAPDLPGIHRDLGTVLLRLESLEAAIASYQQATQLDNGNPALYLELGAAQIKAGQTKMGIESYDTAIALNPDLAAIYLKRLGNAHLGQNDFAAAVSAYHRSLAINPQQHELHMALGKVLLQLQQTEEAIAAYQAAVSLQPEKPAVYRDLGHASRQAGNYQAAVTAYRQSLKLNPQQYPTLIALGNTLCQMKKWAAAVKVFEQAIELKPDRAPAYNGFANARQKQGDLKAAIKAYRRSLKLNPRQLKTYLALGSNLHQVGQLEAAIAVYSKAAKLKPQNPGVHHRLGNTRLKLGQNALAISSYQTAIKLNPQASVDIYQKLAQCLHQQGQVRAALSTYQTALKLKPQCPEMLTEIANISRQLPAASKVVCILGMHRSGTSCLAGSLQGVGIPGGMVNRYAADNLRGNRENEAIMALNKQILRDNNAAWNFPPASLNYTLEHQQERDRLVEKLNSQFPVWMFKDPRTVLTLPFWQEGISELQFVATFRHPLKVARSLHQRQDSVPLRQGLQLWIDYNSLILAAYDRGSFPLICFDLTPPEYLAQLTAIIDELEPQLSVKLHKSKITEFYEPTLTADEFMAIAPQTPEDTQLLAQAESIYRDLRIKAGLPADSSLAFQPKCWLPLETSQAAYNEAILSQPHNARLYFMLAKIQHQEGDLAAAIASLTTAHNLEPDNIDLAQYLSQLFIEAEQTKAAITVLEQIIERRPQDPRAYLSLGKIQRQENRIPEAITAYQQAVALVPEDLTAQVHLGRLLLQDNQIDEAIDHYQQALALHAQSHHIYSDLGKAYTQQKNWQQVIKVYQRAIALHDKASATIYINLANAFKQQGQKRQAIAAYQNAIDSKPDHANGYIGLGNYYRQQKRWSKAIANYQRAIELNCQNPGVYFALGESWRKQRNWNKARSNYQKALELNFHKSFELHKVMGDVLIQLEEIDAAISAYQKARAINPHSSEIERILQQTLTSRK